jgi:hypothetical protein
VVRFVAVSLTAASIVNFAITSAARGDFRFPGIFVFDRPIRSHEDFL